MKTILLAVTFLLATSSAAPAQFAPTTENLRGLKGVRLMVMSGRPDGSEDPEWPGVLKVVEADVTAKLQEAGIQLFRYGDEIKNAGYPRLIVMIKHRPNGYPLETEVKLLQKVLLVRDPSIQTDAVTWRLDGIGGPRVDIAMIRRQVGVEIDRFIKDYFSVNPKQSANSGKDKSKDIKHPPPAVVR
jgi:hypothetical protein